MAISNLLTKLNTTKNNIKQAIIDKGVDILPTDTFENDYATRISEISGGGTSEIPHISKLTEVKAIGRNFLENEIGIIQIEPTIYGFTEKYGYLFNNSGNFVVSQQDSNYIYVIGDRDAIRQKHIFLKIKKSDLSVDSVLEIDSVGFASTAAYSYLHGNFMFVIFSPMICVINISDMSLVHSFRVEVSSNQAMVLVADDDNIYVSVGATFRIYKYRRSDYGLVATSSNFSGGIYAMAQDSSFIYVGGMTDTHIRKLNKSDLTVAATTSVAYGGSIFSIEIDSNHIYVSGQSANLLRKYQISDLSHIGNSSTISGTYYKYSVSQNGDFIYLSASSRVYKILKSTLATSLTSDVNFYLWGGCSSIIADSTYVYAFHESKIFRFLVTDMSAPYEKPTYTGNVMQIYSKWGKIFACGGTSFMFHVYNPESNFALIGTSPNMSSEIKQLAFDDDYIYSFTAASKSIKKHSKTDFSVLASSADIPVSNGFLCGSVVGDYIYVASISSGRVYKYNKSNLTLVSGMEINYASNNAIIDIYCDDTHLYIVGNQYTYNIRKYLLSDFSFVGESTGVTLAQSPTAITIIDNEIYWLGGDGAYSFDKETLNFSFRYTTSTTYCVTKHKEMLVFGTGVSNGKTYMYYKNVALNFNFNSRVTQARSIFSYGDYLLIGGTALSRIQVFSINRYIYLFGDTVPNGYPSVALIEKNTEQGKKEKVKIVQLRTVALS
jgi:hypothetical protein